MKYMMLFTLFFVITLSQFSSAQIPRTISYQGILTDASGNPKPDGDYNFIFSLYEANSGGDAIWSETKTLNVSKGLFSTSLGDLTAFGANVAFNKPYWLGIKVGDESELSPRIALTSSGYSFSSDVALNIIDGKVVKSLNNLKDDITLEGSGGTTINSNGNTITISSSGTGGTGIQGVQNTNNTIDVINPNGPTATVNVKVPLTLDGSANGNNYLFTANNTGSGHGILGVSVSGYANVGIATGTTGQTVGVVGNSFSPDGYGVSGWNLATTGYSVGVVGRTSSPAGVGIRGFGGQNGFGVWGSSPTWGVYGTGETGVYGYGTVGVWGQCQTGTGHYAGYFYGNVHVNGDFSVNGNFYSDGTKAFEIDHPLDPENKYLIHSCVESSERMNIYNGNITTDGNGSATVELPGYFEALNVEYRYQLTTIGQPAQVWIENKIRNNRFEIRSDKPNVEISWQVTGVRNDEYAKQHPFVVEQEKEQKDKGKYLMPELFGQPKEMGIHYVKDERPELNQQQLKKN